MKQTNQTANRRRWMRTGAVGVVFLAAVLCFGVQSRREKQTVVLEKQVEDADAAEISEPLEMLEPEEAQGNFSGGQNRFLKEVDDSQEPEVLYIHVCGEVAAPGVYELPVGSRMYEAVEKAGGMMSEAAQEYVNLAQTLEDGQQLWIPSREEIKEYRENGKNISGLMGDGSAAGNGGVAGLQKAGSNAGTSRTAVGAAEAGDSSVSGALINLNTASKEELMTLNGIGAARAEAILSYRDQKGGFRTIEDIMKVPGIKNAAFQKIKDKITV